MKTNAWIPLIVSATAMTICSLSTAQAALSISTFGAHVVNFDSTVNDVNNGAFTGSGFQSAPSSGQLDSDSWAVTGWNDGNLTFGGTATTGDYARGAVNTAQSTGGIYGYDVDVTAGVNRGLGIQPGGGDWAPGTLTLKIQNNTGQAIGEFQLSYVVYIRNDQQRGNSFNFSYSTDDSTYSPVGALDLTSAAASDALGLVANNRSTLISGLGLAPGDFFYLRWSGADVNGSGNRDEFVLDDISITGVPITPVPEPTNIALGIFAGGLVAFALGKKLKAEKLKS